MSYPSKDREYVIVVPNCAYRKSNHFMTSIAIKYLANKPSNIILFDETGSFLQKKPHIQHLLFIDDASYSGRQLQEFLDTNFAQLKTRRAVIHLAIPFINLDVSRFVKRFYSDVVVHPHEPMLSMRVLNKLGFYTLIK